MTGIHNFRDWFCHLVETNFGPTGHQYSHSARMHHCQHFCHFFLNASWQPCSVRVFSTAYDSTSITSIVSKWQPFSFIFNRGNREK
jgi:hypothetical protein